MVHYGAIWNNVLEVGTADNIFKSRTLNGAFCLYSKQGFYFSILWLIRYLCQTPYNHIFIAFCGALNSKSLLEQVNENATLRAWCQWCFQMLTLMGFFRCLFFMYKFCGFVVSPVWKWYPKPIPITTKCHVVHSMLCFLVTPNVLVYSVLHWKSAHICCVLS